MPKMSQRMHGHLMAHSFLTEASHLDRRVIKSSASAFSVQILALSSSATRAISTNGALL
jgi:hypothetical protein